MEYTKAPWVYNAKRCSIQSTTEMLVEPELDDDGIPVTVASLVGAGGGYSTGDVRLMTKAPEMYELLKKISELQYTRYYYDNNAMLDDILKMVRNMVKTVEKV